MKGGITEHGEESQGREEEGRQEAVTSPVRKKGGGRRPLFTFLSVTPRSRPHSCHDEDHPRINGLHRLRCGGGCFPARRSLARRPAAAAKRPLGRETTRVNTSPLRRMARVHTGRSSPVARLRRAAGRLADRNRCNPCNPWMKRGARSAAGHRHAVPDAHLPDDVPLLNLIDDLHAGDHAPEHGVLRIEMRLR